jgi:predicted GIY-YIG superfamily endonuclease
MEKEALKEVLYGGLAELMKKREYYYNSGISSSYNHFTEKGIEAVNAYVTSMASLVIEAEEKSLNKRAKELVVKGLKGETI